MNSSDRNILCGILGVTMALVIVMNRPHWMGFHDYRWHGGEGNFYTVYGEARSMSLRSGFGAVADTETLKSLMRGQGWGQLCEVCGESRWE